MRDRGRDAGSAIAFGLGTQLDRFRRLGRYDVLFRLEANHWNGTVAPQLVVRRVLDAPERYESLRDWLADQWRLPAAERSPDAAAIFAELGLDAETSVKRPLLESEAFRALVDEPEPDLAARRVRSHVTLRTRPSWSTRSNSWSSGTRSTAPRSKPARRESSASAFSASSIDRSSPLRTRSSSSLVVIPCSRANCVARVLVGERKHHVLAGDVQLAGRTVERGENDLLQHLLRPLRVAPVARRARVGHLGRRVRGAAERDIDEHERHDCRRRPGDRAHQTLTSRRPRRIGIRASSPSSAATRNEFENAFVTARSSCSWSSSPSAA